MGDKNNPKRSRAQRDYEESALLDAIQAVRSGSSLRKAASLYSVPKSTVGRYIKEGWEEPNWKKVGAEKLLTDEEETSLAAYMRWCEDKNIPFTYQLLKVFAGEILKKKGESDTTVGQDWCRDFIKKYSFSARKSRHVEAPRAVAAATSENIIHYFELLSQQITALDLSDKPSQVWNCDEKGWSKQQNIQQPVIVTKGKKQAKTRQIYVNEHITTLHCFNANGDVLAPMTIFNRNIPTSMDVSSLPETWHYATTESGYVNGDLFFQWFRDMFVTQIGRIRPQLLIFDAASPHISADIIRLAVKEDISLISLPGKTTSFLQPVDQILSLVCNKFSELAYKMSFTKFEFLVRPNNFPLVLSQALKIAWPRSVIIEAFKKTGMFPPDIDPIIQSHQLTVQCKEKLKAYFKDTLETEEVVEDDDVPEMTQDPLTEETAEAAVDETLPATVVIDLCGECGRPEDDPCKTCIAREKRKNNILYKSGQISEELIDILETPIVPPPRGKTRLVKAKLVSGPEVMKDYEERQEAQRKRDEKKRKQSDGLPDILPPKRSRKSTSLNKGTSASDVHESQDSQPSDDQQPENNQPDHVQSTETQPPETLQTPNQSPISQEPTTSRGRRVKHVDYTAMNNGNILEENFAETVTGKGKKRKQNTNNYQEECCSPVEGFDMNQYKCPGCRITGEAEDEVLGIMWYGCDCCDAWWHRHCLPADIRAVADLSCMESGVQFKCPNCLPNTPCVVCLIPILHQSQKAQCKLCNNVYHITCLPPEYREEFFRYVRIGKDWYCNQCGTEE